MYLSEMKDSINEANQVLDNADKIARKMASLLVGRLKHCHGSDLAKLKKELKDFDSRDWKWIEK